MDATGFFITLFAALTLLSYHVLINKSIQRQRKAEKDERRYVSRRDRDRRKRTRLFILFDRRNGKMIPNRRLKPERRETNREGH